MLSIDLNCDMGEGFLQDDLIMPFISSVNIACGCHAGDIETMKHTIEYALKNNVAIGAHPSYPDKENFGRVKMEFSSSEIFPLIKEQVELLEDMAKTMGAKLHHVKPHGALYNAAAQDEELSDTICQVIKIVNDDLTIYGLSGSKLIEVAKKNNLETRSEVFADRTYQDDGSLTPRNQPNALIKKSGAALQQVLTMIKESKVISISGKEIPIVAETICIHGDGENAAEFAKKIYGALLKNNIRLG
jgi:UPF0271 protein